MALSAVVWFQVRLSLAFPLTLLRREIVIGESWRLTRGRFWTLFGAYLVIFVLVTALSVAATFATSGSYFIDIFRNMTDPAAMQRIMAAQLARQAGGIGAMTVLGWLLSAAAGALTIALGGGALATAARALTAGQESIADTFA
jgi:membrane-anchored glycerophosphoryl diester phosphodiesterase (GDPDase)